MILVDTSVWVNHLKVGDARLVGLLEAGVAAVHPFTEGELALAGADVRRALGGVARVACSPHAEVLEFARRQVGPVRRVGWVDAHLVHAALVGGLDLLTYDTHQAAFFASARP
jgi:predicted nucleic acid-binding protein